MIDHTETVRIARAMADQLRAKIAAGEIDAGQAATATMMAAHSLAGDRMNNKAALSWMNNVLRLWRRDKPHPV